jgi:hypothetical protein
MLGVQELGSWTKELGNLVVYVLLSDIYYAISPNSSTAFQAPFSSQTPPILNMNQNARVYEDQLYRKAFGVELRDMA